MSTSLFAGLIRSEAAHWDAYAPADTAFARGLASNAAHLADSSAQVVANWRADDFPISRDEDAALNDLGVAARPYAIWSSQLFHHRMRPDGTSYRIRVRVRAATVNGNAAVIRVIVRGSSGVVPNAGEINALTYSFSSSTPAWLTGGTGGDGSGNIYLRSGSEALTDRATLISLSPGDPTTVRYTASIVQIWGVPTGGGTGDRIRIYGVHAAEYIGT